MTPELPKVELYPNLAREVGSINKVHGTKGTEIALAHIADNATHYRGTRVWVDFMYFVEDYLAWANKNKV